METFFTFLTDQKIHKSKFIFIAKNARKIICLFKNIALAKTPFFT